MEDERSSEGIISYEGSCFPLGERLKCVQNKVLFCGTPFPEAQIQNEWLAHNCISYVMLMVYKMVLILSLFLDFWGAALELLLFARRVLSWVYLQLQERILYYSCSENGSY